MNRSVTDADSMPVAQDAAGDGMATRRGLATPAGLVITRAEWNAMVCEDPQADPSWPESWLGAIDPLANRRVELGAEDHPPPTAGLLTKPA